MNIYDNQASHVHVKKGQLNNYLNVSVRNVASYRRAVYLLYSARNPKEWKLEITMKTKIEGV